MKTFTIALLSIACCFGQGRESRAPTGVRDDSGLSTWKPASSSVSLNARTASSLGAVLDCNLATGAKIGGGTATDNTAVLQAYLTTATAANPVYLIIDGPSLITGLKINAAGYTTIAGFGGFTGFFVKSGSNAAAIETIGVDGIDAATGNPLVGPGTAFTSVPSRGAWVAMRNFQVNGNRGTFTSGTYNQDGNSSGAHYQGGTTYSNNLNLSSYNHVRIEGIWSVNSPAWNIHLGNMSDVVVRDCWIYETNGTNLFVGGTQIWNGDGIDILGPSEDVSIDGIKMQNLGDDGIAINAAMGWSGAISRVTVSNCNFINTTSIIRIFSEAHANNRHVIDGVAISNITGYSLLYGIILDVGYGGDTPTALDWIRHVTITNASFAAPEFVDVEMGSTGDLSISNSIWSPTTDGVAAINVLVSAVVGGVTGIGDLSLSNFTIHRGPDGAAAGTLLSIPAGAVFGRVSLEGVRVTNAVSTSTAAIASAIDVQGTLTRLWVGSMDPTLITATLSGAGSTNITTIQGPGVTAAGLTAK